MDQLLAPWRGFDVEALIPHRALGGVPRRGVAQRSTNGTPHGSGSAWVLTGALDVLAVGFGWAPAAAPAGVVPSSGRGARLGSSPATQVQPSRDLA